ncbi:MAG: hypothetical protein IJW46_07370 [Clostridia bacterium]|nr:hypothetical protein [Clostridia bacterium]
MKKILGIAFLLAVLTITLLLTACGNAQSDETLSVNTLPEITTEEISQGTLYVRCSEPEDNVFSIQFVGAVPTNYVDYVGFEACIVYPDGTRGTRQTIKLHTLYRTVTGEDDDTVITSEDFGIEDGYLFVRALDRIPTDRKDLCYEIAAYYVIGNEKTYTAKQTFSIAGLLEEHILSDPKPFDIVDSTDLVDVQKWVKCEGSETLEDETLSSTYYLGASLPDDNGNLKMYACFAVPSAHINTTGIRYRFTQMSGALAGVSTQLCRVRANVLYKQVITETETLTVEDFGLTDGYLVLIAFEEAVNIVTRDGFSLNLLLYFSRNALETVISEQEFDFTELVKETVLSRQGVTVTQYTYIPTHFNDWMYFGEAYGNATGTGLFRIRLTDATNSDGDFEFSMQIATAVPTRFSPRIAFVYTAYDKDGNVIGTPNREINATTIYPTIFDNDGKTMTPADFGIERGYIMSMALNYIKYESEVAAIKLEAYYTKDNQKITLASQTISLDTLREYVDIIL